MLAQPTISRTKPQVPRTLACDPDPHLLLPEDFTGSRARSSLVSEAGEYLGPHQAALSPLLQLGLDVYPGCRGKMVKLFLLLLQATQTLRLSWKGSSSNYSTTRPPGRISGEASEGWRLHFPGAGLPTVGMRCGVL